MMNLIEKRWVEVQFYDILIKIYYINNDSQDIFYFMELLNAIFKNQTETYKTLATKVLYNLRTKPTKKDYAILAHHFKVPIIDIAKHTGYSVKYLYKEIKTWNINELNIYPNEYTDTEYELMQNFINNIQNLKEWLT